MNNNYKCPVPVVAVSVPSVVISMPVTVYSHPFVSITSIQSVVNINAYIRGHPI